METGRGASTGRGADAPPPALLDFCPPTHPPGRFLEMSSIPQIDNLGDITTDAGRLFQRIAALLAARNAANDAQQRYADITAGVGAESLGRLGRAERQHAADNLYDATYELIHRIDNMVTSVEWENMILGLDK